MLFLSKKRQFLYIFKKMSEKPPDGERAKPAIRSDGEHAMRAIRNLQEWGEGGKGNQ